MADNYSNLLEAFESLNRRKREDPKRLTDEEQAEWKRMRREIENVLFNAEPDRRTDTREYLRVPVYLAIRYWSHNELKDRYISVLGEAGVFVSTVDPLPVGTKLDLEIVLASKGFSFELIGEVVWLNEGEDPAKRGMGIAFKNLNYEQKRIIYGLVDDSLRQQLLERRKYARVDTRLRVKCVYAEGTIEVNTQDLSLNGMFITTDRLTKVGDKINLALHVESNQPAVRAVGEVVRLVKGVKPGETYGMGIRFVKMNQTGQKALRNYMAKAVSNEQRRTKRERRQYPRVNRLVKLRFQSMDECISTLARDLSNTGLFIQTHDCLPVGEVVQVFLVHPVNLTELEIVGKVVRYVESDPDNPAQQPGIAVVFDKLSDDKKEQLRWFLQDTILLPKEKWQQGDPKAKAPRKRKSQKKKPD